MYSVYTMEFKIRQAVLSDLPYVYSICVKTGNSGADATNLFSDPMINGQYYAAPYLHYELDACFILEADYLPSGYVIGVSSTLSFNEWMNSNWLIHVRKYYPRDVDPKSELEKQLVEIIHTDCTFPDYLSEYPSHLHIDLLPVAQKKGFGKKMIYTLFDRMREKGSNGIHLSVGERNVNAIGFYKKLGFSELKRESGAVVMGFRLNR